MCVCVCVQIPSTYTPGGELPLNQFTELLRGECAMAGFTEVLTWYALTHTHTQSPPLSRRTHASIHARGQATWDIPMCVSVCVCHNRALCSKAENSSALRRGEGAPGDAVEIGNPATLEFEVRGTHTRTHTFVPVCVLCCAQARPFVCVCAWGSHRQSG